MKTRSCTMSESETTSEWNWKVIRDREAGRRGARSHKVTFTLDDILALKGLIQWIQILIQACPSTFHGWRVKVAEMGRVARHRFLFFESSNLIGKNFIIVSSVSAWKIIKSLCIYGFSVFSFLSLKHWEGQYMVSNLTNAKYVNSKQSESWT